MEMKPGRELDALVAEKVMGWRWFEQNTDMKKGPLVQTRGWYGPGQSIVREQFSPSTDIAAAWEVVEKLREHHGYLVSVIQNGPGWEEAYRCKIMKGVRSQSESRAATAPHAICLAALKAVGL